MEALILYFVLFFPGAFGFPLPGNNAVPESIPFSALRELSRLLVYTVPSLALVWYLLSGRRGFSAFTREKPQRGDVFSFLAGFPGLLFLGLGLSFLLTVLPAFTNLTPPPRVEAPASAAGWIIVVLSCLGTGYLEESYFRYYLFIKQERQLPQAAARIAFSTLLFALCHIYEGPWGALNAALAGLLLSALFFRFRSLHGIALAHGMYNIFVYITGLAEQSARSGFV